MNAPVKLKERVATVTTTVGDDPHFAGLNEEQLAAARHDRGPLLIIAGAGTGKTTVIARRVAWLINSGRVRPEEVLALTFTNKAADEMTERIESHLPLGYLDLWVSTFHVFCQRLLQTHALDIGLPDDFRLLNETDAYLLVRRNFDRFKLDYYRPLGNPTKFIHALLQHFSRAKDEAVSPAEYLAHAKRVALDKDRPDAEESSRLQELADAYHTYQQLLLEQGCLDFGDLLLYTLELLRKRPKILEKYRAQFRQVVVDEFQDTNWAQYELLKLLVPRDGNIVVVGDDDQSIYKFRGASISNILQFKNDFPGAREVVLTRNYRSGQGILDLSYAFIQQNNPNRLEARLAAESGATISKRLQADKTEPAEIRHWHYATLADEAAGVADRIVELKEADSGRSWSDFCVLVRSNGAADDFSQEFQRRGLPFQFLALKGLYAKPIILDCLAYFRCLDDYHESAALYRLLSSPPYRIDGNDLIALNHEATKKAQSLYEVLRRQASLPDLAVETRTTVDRLLGHLERHAQLARQKGVTELLVKFLYDSGYMKIVSAEDSVAGREQTRYLKQFLDRLKRFEAQHDEPSLRHFMEEFEMERESGEAGGLSFDVETGPDMVRIMTVHAAKGLEFPFVFVVNLVDKRFPSVNRGGGIELPDALTKEMIPEGDIHLQEERRLFYVAMTRAKQGLYFTSAEDYGGKLKKKISRFIRELGFPEPAAPPSVSEAVLPEPSEPPPAKLPEYALPTRFSFTQLAAYAKCPLQYKFAHVVRIPVFGKPTLSFGKTVHATLEKFLREISARQATAQTSLFGGGPGAQGSGGQELPVSEEELQQMYEEAWLDDWYPDKAIKEEYRDKGRAILKKFYQDCRTAPPMPLYLEKDFTLKVGQYAIRGKIDRIDQRPDGSVDIIDYKTGTPKSADDLQADDKRQLLLYQVAVERLMGLRPAQLTYHYLDDGSQAHFLGNEKEIAKFDNDIEAQISQITDGDFRAKPGMHCKFCDFANICEYREG